VVELITQYDKYCSPEELNRLIEHNTDDMAAWKELIGDLRLATQSQLAPQSPQAQSLINRWGNLMLQRVGGDKNLLIKMKLAYAKDSGMQSRMEMQGGITPEMMQYLGLVYTHAHLALWSRHLNAEQVKRLRLDEGWQQKLLQIVGALRQAMSDGLPATHESVRQALSEWDSLVDHCVGGDAAVRAKVVSVLATDPEIQFNWILDAELQHFMAAGRVSRLASAN
jgi:hypothetical protein